MYSAAQNIAARSASATTGTVGKKNNSGEPTLESLMHHVECQQLADAYDATTGLYTIHYASFAQGDKRWVDFGLKFVEINNENQYVCKPSLSYIRMAPKTKKALPVAQNLVPGNRGAAQWTSLVVNNALTLDEMVAAQLINDSTARRLVGIVGTGNENVGLRLVPVTPDAYVQFSLRVCLIPETRELAKRPVTIDRITFYGFSPLGSSSVLAPSRPLPKTQPVASSRVMAAQEASF